MSYVYLPGDCMTWDANEQGGPTIMTVPAPALTEDEREKYEAVIFHAMYYRELPYDEAEMISFSRAHKEYERWRIAEAVIRAFLEDHPAIAPEARDDPLAVVAQEAIDALSETTFRLRMQLNAALARREGEREHDHRS